MPLFKSPQPYIRPDGSLTVNPSEGQLPPTLGPVVYEWMATNLVHGEGDLLGEPFQLPDHFVEPLYRMYEYHPETGRRLVKRCLIGTPKGSAKTEFAGGVVAAELAGPVVISKGVPSLRVSPKIVAAAASEKQADEVYDEAFSRMVKPIEHLLDGPFDKATFRKGEPGQVQRVASKASTNDGKKPTCVVADEFHEWVDGKARNHLVLTNGLGKRADSLELDITTAGDANVDSPCQRLYKYGLMCARGEVFDPAFLFFWWQFPETVDYTDGDDLRAALRESNPAVWADIDWMVKRAKQIPEHEHRRYYGNEWTVTETRFITGEAWDRCAAPDRPWRDQPVVLFFDSSYSLDASALVAVTIEDVPHVALLGLWENPAFLLDQQDMPEWLVDDDEVQIAVEQAMADLDVRQLWFDPHGQGADFGKKWAERWGDVVAKHNPRMIGTVVAPACSEMYAAVYSDTPKVTHDGSEGLRRHLTNAIRHDTPDGAYIKKDGPHSPRKIDAAYAAILGRHYATLYEEPDLYYQGSVTLA